MDTILAASLAFLSADLGIFPSISAFFLFCFVFLPFFFFPVSFLFLNIWMACCTWRWSDGEGSGLSLFLFLASLCKPRGCGGGWEQQSHVPSLAPVPLKITATALSVPWVTERHTHLKAVLCKGKGVALGILV